MSRKGVVGGVVGGVAALGAAGAVAAAAQQRRSVGKLRELAEAEPERFSPLPADRAGTVTAGDGVPLYYEEVGPADAPLTVVFVHGYTLTMASWWFQRRDLQRRFGDEIRMVFHDQRSHGRSGRSTTAHSTIDQLGRDLADVLADRVPHGPVVLVGHSMGGMTIMALADHDPELFGAGGRVRGVAFVSTSSGQLSKNTLGLPGVLARLQAPVLAVGVRLARWQTDNVERGRRLGKDVAWNFTRRLSFDDPSVDPATIKFVNDMISATRVDVVADFLPALLNHDKADALRHLEDTDVEIVGADHDVLLPLAHSKAIAAALPHAHLTVVENAGHMALLDRPEIVDDVIGGLIERALQSATKVAS
ncbi:alpha/beta fold hydrolase [Jatrophihabitans sp. YIM 134969]